MDRLLLHTLFLILLLNSTCSWSQKLIVVTENYPPYSFLDGNRVVGVSTDIIRKIMDASELEYEIQLLPWSRAFQMAKTKENVLIYTMTRTEARESEFQWLKQLGEASFYLVGQSGRDYPTSLSSLVEAGHKAVCVLKDAACEWLREAGFTNDLIVEVADNSASSEVKMVLADRVQFFVAEPNYLKYKLKQLNLSDGQFQLVAKVHKSQDYYFAASLGVTQKVLQKINRSVVELENRGEKLLIPTALINHTH